MQISTRKPYTASVGSIFVTLAWMLATVSPLACGNEPQLVLAADTQRNGDLGSDGAFGVWRESRWLGPNGALAVDTELSLPVVEHGNIGPRPAVVFIQGGFVAIERYRWLTQHIASRGFVVLAPRHPFDLAFFAQDNALNALLGARQASLDGDEVLSGRMMEVPAMVLGHSLGGVVGAKAWLRGGREQFSHLALLASEPDPADDFTSRSSGRVLSITGGADKKIQPNEVAAGAQAFARAQVVVVEGMNHYQFTDAASESELASDGVASVDTAQARHLVLTFVDALLETLDGHEVYGLENPSSWPAGVHGQDAP